MLNQSYPQWAPAGVTGLIEGIHEKIAELQSCDFENVPVFDKTLKILNLLATDTSMDVVWDKVSKLEEEFYSPSLPPHILPQLSKADDGLQCFALAVIEALEGMTIWDRLTPSQAKAQNAKIVKKMQELAHLMREFKIASGSDYLRCSSSMSDLQPKKLHSLIIEEAEHLERNPPYQNSKRIQRTGKAKQTFFLRTLHDYLFERYASHCWELVALTAQPFFPNSFIDKDVVRFANRGR